jgi:hypothetical protein
MSTREVALFRPPGIKPGASGQEMLHTTMALGKKQESVAAAGKQMEKQSPGPGLIDTELAESQQGFSADSSGIPFQLDTTTVTKEMERETSGPPNFSGEKQDEMENPQGDMILPGQKFILPQVTSEQKNAAFPASLEPHTLLPAEERAVFVLGELATLMLKQASQNAQFSTLLKMQSKTTLSRKKVE